jgi:phospholipase/carboxylesterase
MSDSGLVLAEREPRDPAAARGLLVLHHGRGADERDLLTLADVLDPAGELHVVTPRAPLQLGPSPGYHWYLVPRVGTPDPDTFASAYAKLAALHDELWERTGIGPERTVLGGFSMGSVMSYALGLGPDRPRPAGILAFSGFLPSVPGWEPDLESRRGMPVLIEHGRNDAIIDVQFGRAAEQRLRDGGLAVTYRESEAGHHIDPRELPVAQAWVRDTLQAPPVRGA